MNVFTLSAFELTSVVYLLIYFQEREKSDFFVQDEIV